MSKSKWERTEAEKTARVLEIYKDRPHPLMRTNYVGNPELPAYVSETLIEARTAHHLLDLLNIPHGTGYESDLDVRVYKAVRKALEGSIMLGRVISWHSRSQGPHGTFDDYCNECDRRWPCDTYKLATGTYEEEPDPQQ